jgi:anti-sigma-K factor RskA
MNLLRPPLLDALARDYVLGTLAGPARRRFERELRRSAAAEQAVLGWQQRLAALADVVPPLEPSPAVWAGLEQRLFAPAPAPATPSPWRRLADLFSPRSLGGALAGIVLAVVVLREQPGWVGLEPARQTLPASYVGLLHDKAGRPALLASARRHGSVLPVKMLQPLAVPPGRVAVLWALPRGGAAPVAVGPVPAQGNASLALAGSAEQVFADVDRLAVSFEADAGAKRPTGPFQLQGDCVRLW